MYGFTRSIVLAGTLLLAVGACATNEVSRPPDGAPVVSAPIVVEPAKAIFPAEMSVCPGMAVSNRPATDANLVMIDYRPFVVVEGKVTLASAPVEAGCFSSGFGPRGSGSHNGIDYYNATAVSIFAAGDGVVKEKTYRDDYGNIVVIDHGDGVYTRYAHLQSFSTGLKKGVTVRRGDVIGQMGNTGKYKVARHLHYEVLTGSWGMLAGSFALTPVDVTKLPAARDAGS
jgi:murein DD-endopeptidase MepM/ murein hydrolase activator NlpD